MAASSGDSRMPDGEFMQPFCAYLNGALETTLEDYVTAAEIVIDVLLFPPCDTCLLLPRRIVAINSSPEKADSILIHSAL